MEKSPEAFRTISELAELLETPAHVLRFWESRFPQIKPVKRAGGRRYYRPADVALIAGIRRLLHDEGLTIRGVQKMLREQGVRHVASFAAERFLDPTAFDAPDPVLADDPPPAEIVALAEWRDQRREPDPTPAAAPPQPPQPSLFDLQPSAEPAPENTPVEADESASQALVPQPETVSPESAAPLTEGVTLWFPPLIRALPRDLPSVHRAGLAAIFQRLQALRDRLEEGRGVGRR